MKLFTQLLVLSCLSLLNACSTAPKSEIPLGEIPSVSDSQPNRETLVILGTNDIHGQVAPLIFKTREPEGTPPLSYEAGGLSALSGIISEARRQFGDRLLWLDAGDQFQGSIESNSQKGAPLVQFFNMTRLKAAAVGNHEFDYGPLAPDQPDPLGTAKARMKEAQYPYLSANILEKSTGKPYPFPNTFPSMIAQVGKVKVGVIGLSTPDTRTTAVPLFIRDLNFSPLKEAALREAQNLRQQGAQIVIAVIHAGLKCGTGKASPYHAIRKPTDPLGECGPQDEVVQLLKALPPGTVDAVVSGHTHSVVHHWVSGVPVIQSGASTRYVNLIYLTYDLKEQRILTDLTRIEGPIPVCPKVFRNQSDCSGERPAPKAGRGPLVDPVFHGKTVHPDPEVDAFLKPIFEQSRKIKAELLGEAARPIEHPRLKESAMGNLVTDAIRDYSKADFALMNGGSIRTTLEPGKITYGDIFQAYPFDNYLAVLRVTGRELKNILRNMESGARGFHSVSGLRLRLIAPEYDAPSNDLDRNGKVDPWEINRLLEVQTSTGESIRDAQFYTLATADFLLQGGDDMKWSMSQVPTNRIEVKGEPQIRDIIAQYVRKGADGSGAAWNTVERPLVDPNHPRLIFENPDAKKKKTPKNKKTRHSRQARHQKKHQ